MRDIIRYINDALIKKNIYIKLHNKTAYITDQYAKNRTLIYLLEKIN